MVATCLAAPPPPLARAAFPPGFGTRFAIFADAEEEFDWSAPFSRSATATDTIRALPEATARFAERGIVPTYLIDYPVAINPQSACIVSALARAGLCDIGAQLHAWVTPPHDEIVGVANSFQGNLPERLEAAKIRAITDATTRLTDTPPVAFRAGRYGVGPATARLLVEAGYRLDVSVRPGFEYRDQQGPDFSRHPVTPYWCAEDLLEVPLGATRIGPLARVMPHAPQLRGLLARTRLARRVALTPEGFTRHEARRAIDTMLRQGVQLLSLSFHTPSLVPGHTPYVRDAADLARFWRWWDDVLDHLGRAGTAPIRAHEIVAAADAARLASAPAEPLSGCPGPVAQG